MSNTRATELVAPPELGTPIPGIDVPKEDETPEYKNSMAQLSQNEMSKLDKLIKWNDSVFKRLLARVRRKEYSTEGEPVLDLRKYTEILFPNLAGYTRAPRHGSVAEAFPKPPSDPAVVRDVLRQMIALKQILEKKRIILDKKNISIFQNADGSSMAMLILKIATSVGTLVGVFSGVGIFFTIVNEITTAGEDTEMFRKWLTENSNPNVYSSRLIYDKAAADAKWAAAKANGSAQKIWNKYLDGDLPTMRGSLWDPDSLKFVGTFAAKGVASGLGVGVLTKLLERVRNISKKLNQQGVIKELDIILDAAKRMHPDLYSEVETSLQLTIIDEPVTMKFSNFVQIAPNASNASNAPATIKFNNFVQPNAPVLPGAVNAPVLPGAVNEEEYEEKEPENRGLAPWNSRYKLKKGGYKRKIPMTRRRRSKVSKKTRARK